MSGDASDVTKLRKIQNTLNIFPLKDSGSYTQYIKMHAITTSCSVLNNCYASPCYVNGCYVGTFDLSCNSYDIYGPAPIKYFSIPIDVSLANCVQYNKPVTDNSLNMGYLDYKCPMFQTPRMQIRPPAKMQINTIECCTDKNIKNPLMKYKIPHYRTISMFKNVKC